MSKQTVIKVELKLAFKKVDKTDIGCKLIGMWTKSNYSHVEIILDGKWVSSDSDTGVVIRELKPLKDNWDYVTLPTISLCNKHYSFLSKYINNLNGGEYDWKGIIFSQTIPLGLHNKDKWFCSELVTKLLQLMLVEEVIDIDPNLVSPRDLHDIFSKHI